MQGRNAETWKNSALRSPTELNVRVTKVDRYSTTGIRMYANRVI